MTKIDYSIVHLGPTF